MFLWDARTFGFLYVATVSQFACVISTLETSYGIKAMIKGRQLLKGNFGFPLLIQLLFYLLFNELSPTQAKPGPRRKSIRQVALQHLPLSTGTNSWIPGRLVPGDTMDKLKRKARRGFFPGRDTPATLPGPHSFSQTMKCHGEGFSRATCRPGLYCY
ncbi:hypothetical protein Tco_0205810 [Tanacetum coccineum]